VDRFVVASVRREARERAVNRRLLYSPTEFEWIRDRVLANVEPERTCPHAPRIYISRAGATVRRVENETETMDLLTEWDFVRYAPEDLSLAEQVTLFSQAEAIVAPHGSGLMNQIWADEATVIEMFGPKHGVTDPAIEYYLADLLGHDYGCLQGETVGPDVRVDIDALESLLGRMLEA
jgi:capsular polysaccharide biosynthesis protein